jgi:hypothetical protein
MKCHELRLTPRIAAMVSLLSVQLIMATANASRFASLAPGEAATFKPFAEGNSLEGIAIHKDVMFVGNRRETVSGVVSEILKVSPDGDVSTLTTFASPTTGEGVLGLAISHQGELLAAVHSPGTAAHGVWKINSLGEQFRLPNSELMSFPNAITSDAKGNVYVSDSVFFSNTLTGGIWRFPAQGTGELWIEDPVLGPFTLDDFLIPPVGANGVAFHPGHGLYVANTQRGQLLNIPINADGTPGIPEIVAGNREDLVNDLGPIPSIDGIAIDARSDIHAVLPAFAVATLFGLPTAPVVKINPATGEVTRSNAAAYDGLFDFPLSLVYDGESVFVANGAFRSFDFPIPEPGPHVVEVGEGVPGFPGFDARRPMSTATTIVPEPSTALLVVLSAGALVLRLPLMRASNHVIT